MKSKPKVQLFKTSRVQSQDSILNILYPDSMMLPLSHISTTQVIPKSIKWSLRKIQSIVEKQSAQTQRSTSRTKHESHNLSSRMIDSNAKTIKKEKRQDKLLESERQRLGRFLSSHELCAAIQKRSISKIDLGLFEEDVDKEISTQRINQIKHQYIRYKFQGKVHELAKDQLEGPINALKQRSYNSVYQKIQELRNIQRTKKAPLWEHSLITNKSKLVSNKKTSVTSKNQKSLQNNIVCYQVYSIWFNFPLDFNRKFYNMIITGDIDGVVQKLTIDPHYIHMRNQYGQTPLHISSICNNLQMVQLLIKMGSHIEAQDNKNYTPLYYAYSAGSAEAILSSKRQNGSKSYDHTNEKYFDACQVSIHIQIMEIRNLIIMNIDFDKIFQHIQESNIDINSKGVLIEQLTQQKHLRNIKTELIWNNNERYLVLSGTLGVQDDKSKKKRDVLLELRFGLINTITFKIIKPNGINIKQQINASVVTHNNKIENLSQALEQEQKKYSIQYPYESDYIEDEMEARETIVYICKEYQKMVDKTRKVSTILIDRQDNLKKSNVKVIQIKQQCEKDTKYLTNVLQNLENCESIAAKLNEKNQDLQNIFELDPLSEQIIDLQAQILTFKDAFLQFLLFNLNKYNLISSVARQNYL
ncbi:hypothetical protein pb186bvf_000740 [Paramecium bursaria]